VCYSGQGKGLCVIVARGRAWVCYSGQGQGLGVL